MCLQCGVRVVVWGVTWALAASITLLPGRLPTAGVWWIIQYRGVVDSQQHWLCHLSLSLCSLYLSLLVSYYLLSGEEVEGEVGGRDAKRRNRENE